MKVLSSRTRVVPSFGSNTTDTCEQQQNFFATERHAVEQRRHNKKEDPILEAVK
jgi:hypothetical protein